MPIKELRYLDFAEFIDIDEFEAAIQFEPDRTDHDEDIGYCILPWGLHKHGDSTGKFAINREKRVYNCWVCGGGDLLDLTVAVKDLSLDAAIEWLYQFASETEESGADWRDRMLTRLNPPRKERQTLPYFNAHVLDRFEHHGYPESHKFWDDRGVTSQTREQFRLGYCPDYTKRDPKGETEDYVGPAVIIPHLWKERLVGWQVRWLDGDRPKWVPKYTNTPDFPKKETLFNLGLEEDRGDPPIIIESVLSALILDGLGYHGIATFGSGLNEEQMRYLVRFQQGVILAADNDPEGKNGESAAGIKWRSTLHNYLKDYLPVWHLGLVGPEGSGKDIGDLLVEEGPAAVDELIGNAYDPLSF